MKKNFVEELKWRGMLAQIMPGAEELLQKEMPLRPGENGPDACLQQFFGAGEGGGEGGAG